MSRVAKFGSMLLLLTAVLGCTGGHFRKVELFAEYEAGAKPQYYRITLAGEGNNGELIYRSGWYNGRAVDQLFGNIAEKQALESAIAARRKEAIRKTFDNYMDALEDPASTVAKVTSAKTAFEAAISNIEGIASVGESPVSALDHADDKFVLLLSNDPDEVVQLIKEQVQNNSVSRSVQNLLFIGARERRASQVVALALENSRVEALLSLLDDFKDRIDKAGKNDELARELGRAVIALEAAQ